MDSRAARCPSVKNIQLAAHEIIQLTKLHSFKPITTRRYYTGLHRIAIQVNGVEMAASDFYLDE
jgi:hypothetical protein